MAPLRRWTGTMTERKIGPRPSLRQASRALSADWSNAAAEVLLPGSLEETAGQRRRFRSRIARRLLHKCQEALIRQDFAYRFHMAMQETCALKRHAMIA